MNRRKFLAVSALAPLARVPALTPPQAPLDLSALLTRFCLTRGDPEYRRPLRSVFTIDGWRVATNGRVCVRAEDRAARRLDAAAPMAENLNWSGPWGPGFRIERFPHEPDYLPCVECGRVGDWIPHDDEAWCYWCEGEGRENNRTGELPDEFGGLRFRLGYVQAVLMLPDVVWHMPEIMPYHLMVGYDVPQGPIRFTWQRGDGLLMPVAKDLAIKPDCDLSAQWERRLP